ncbi:phosphatidylinositol kinase, partial [Reticulomyxa filosa]
NACSLSSLKHRVKNFTTLHDFFEQYFGPIGSSAFDKAQKNFVESMAAYSLVCYFLQVKDRHNGNILIDNEGRIIHIDFGFIMSNSPGGNVGFESAPFKLTEEFIQVMGGEQKSDMFNYFRILIIRGFMEIRKHARKFLLLAKIMFEGAPMPCFIGGQSALEDFKSRFAEHLSNEVYVFIYLYKCVEYVYELVDESSCNWRTVQYDMFQRITNNIW